METKTIDQMTTEELQAYLEERKREEVQKAQQAREEYEKFVDKTTSRIVRNAQRISKLLTEFKDRTTAELEQMREKLNEYGAIRANSKGGFLLRTKEGDGKVLYKYASICDWDERAAKAEGLLTDFLKDVVKKRDKELFELIIGLLEKNKEGKLEFSRMQALYAKETLFADPRWVEAIRLFKESFRVIDSKMRLEIYTRNEETKEWVIVPLNLSSI